MSGYQDAIDLKYGDAWLGVLNGLGQDVADLVGGELTDNLVYGSREISSAVDITLVAGDSVLQAITMTVADKAVILPDATTCVAGRPRIITNAGTNGFAIRKNGGAELVAAVAAGEICELRLIDGATAAGEWLTVHHQMAAAPEVTDQTARTNIMLNAFRIAVNGGLSVMNMVDGVVDEFEDETGVDTAASTDETYDSSGDYYHNPGGQSANVLTGAAGYTSTSLHEGTANLAFDGSTSTYMRFADATTDWLRVQLNGAKTLTSFRFMPKQDVATWSGFRVYGSNDGSNWSGQLAIGNTGYNPTCGVWYGPYTFDTTGSYLYYKFECITSVNNNAFIYEVEAFESLTPDDMVLVSEIATAETAPDEAFMVVWEEDVDTPTLNTDLKAWASRDGGTTWTQITLAEEVALATGRILIGTADVSGQPAGTSMKWKITTHNNKELRLHGVGLEWS
jgi:hypothetical protein